MAPNKLLDPNVQVRDIDEIMYYAARLGFGNFHVHCDKATGLHAIIALHSPHRGQALGGCRFIEYDSLGDALIDVMRLAQGMAYKNVMAGLDCAGGKSVILKPKALFNREALFHAFGEFVHSLDGRYIAAMDSGTTVEDMDTIAKATPHVASTSATGGDPSPYTAYGVRHGIQAAVEQAYGREDLKGIHVAIQGVGHVGFALAKELYEAGAKLTLCDSEPTNTQRAVKAFGADVVDIHTIHAVECDVFAPCALGGVLNDKTIPEIKAKVVAGATNNQLAKPKHGKQLHERGILYAPDYVINAGGLIHAMMAHREQSPTQQREKIKEIKDSLHAIFQRAQQENRPTDEVADILAEEKL